MTPGECASGERMETKIMNDHQDWYTNLRKPTANLSYPGRIISRPPLKISISQHVTELLERRIIQKRDVRLLAFLSLCNVLSRDQIWQMFWPDKGKRVVNERLKVLWLNWVLDFRTDVEAMTDAQVRPSRLYYLNSVSKAILAHESNIPQEQIEQARSYTGQAGHLLAHDWMISEFHVAAYILCDPLPGVQPYWWNERQSIIYHRQAQTAQKTPLELARPDATLSLETSLGQYLYYLEMDRGGTDWDKKTAVYKSALTHGDWELRLGREQFPTVLCLVPDRALRGLARRLPHRAGPVTYWLKSWTDFLETGPITGWLDTLTRDTVSLFPESLLSSGVTPDQKEGDNGNHQE